jgi:hypothetical protein
MTGPRCHEKKHVTATIEYSSPTGPAQPARQGHPQRIGRRHHRLADRHRPAAAQAAERPHLWAGVPHRTPRPRRPGPRRHRPRDRPGTPVLPPRRRDLQRAHQAPGPPRHHRPRPAGLSPRLETARPTPLGPHPRRRERRQHRHLLAFSGHASVASLARYTRVSPDALTRWQARRDPHRRR